MDSKYTHRVVSPDGLCSEHKSEAAAKKAAARYQKMGTRPAGYFRVEPITKEPK